MRLTGCAGWSAHLLLQITEDSFSQSHMSFHHERLESKMRNLIFVKYDITQMELIFAQSLQSICSLHVNTPRVILLVTVFFIIQPDKHGNHWTVETTCYPYEIHWGKWGVFLNRKRPSYFIFQEIPDLFSNLKCSNMQLYIRRWYIICMFKFSVQNDISKVILKKKNDVHWISDSTLVEDPGSRNVKNKHFGMPPF